eukprot:9136588-Karenia_brevis.AAC.1
MSLMSTSRTPSMGSEPREALHKPSTWSEGLASMLKWADLKCIWPFSTGKRPSTGLTTTSYLKA